MKKKHERIKKEMNFFEVMKRRKSVRSYTGKAPSAEQMRMILEAAWTSPVARARFENIHLTVITDKGVLQAIVDNVGDRVIRPGSPLYDAPVLILVSAKPVGEVLHNNEYSSAAMIVHNMSLAATALGLGSCDIWGAINLANENPELVKRFELPEGFVPCCSLVLGETDEPMPVREVQEGKMVVSYL